MAEVVLEKVGKVYADGTRAVDGLSLDVADGEFLVLIGPSGCGKTTALRMVAGLEEVSEGVIRIGGRPVNDVPSRDRDVAMVFQSYALYPHLDVYDNIAFGLRLRRVPRNEVERRVGGAADMLGLREHLGRRPGALSGGQRQRVAMGRAMVREPSAFLMDEPLSNLDAKLRVQMRAEIARTTRRMAVTTIYVTHDQTEAMTLGERVAVLKRGVLQQVAAPQDLYDRPDNLFVAGFIGSPAMNLIRGRFVASDNPGKLDLMIGSQRLPVSTRLLQERPGLAGDGWPVTYWFENVYLRVAGSGKYAQLTAHKLPKNLDLSAYPDDTTRALANALVKSTLVQFDMSDQTPQAFGGQTGADEWKILTDFVANPGNPAGTAAAPEAAATKDYGSN